MKNNKNIEFNLNFKYTHKVKRYKLRKADDYLMIKTKKKDFELYIIILIALIFMILILPLIAAAFYCYPNSDDYANGSKIFHWLNGGGNLLGAVKIAFKLNLVDYFTWQGAYFSDFWMYLIPGILGDKHYFIGAFIVMGGFLSGSIYFCKVLLKKCCQCSYKEVFLITMPIIFYWIQFMPSICEGIYWNCGAIYYTFSFGIELLYFGILIMLYNINEKKKLYSYMLIGIFLTFMLGGMNLVTGLQTCIITTILSLFVLVNKNKNKKIFLLLNILIILFFIINIVAPGNWVRAKSGLEQSGAIEAVLKSFITAFTYTIESTNIYMIILLIFEVVIFGRVAKRMAYNFRSPLLVLLGSICVYAATFTPFIFAESNKVVNGRIMNVYYWTYCIFIIGNVLYLEGWLIKKHSELLQKCFDFIKTRRWILIIIAIIILAIAGIRFLDHPKEWNGVNAYKEFYDGEYKQYSIEMKARLKLLRDPDIKDVEFNPLTYYPTTIHLNELRYDETYWENIAIATFYNKNSVKLVDK